MTSNLTSFARSKCPIASSLDLIGDRWTLVILRDMINGKKRFAEFINSPERITTNVLTDRLNAMEASGLIKKRPYQQKPIRYEYVPTKKGMGLHGVLIEICHWGNAFLPGSWVPPESFMKPGKK